MCDFENEICVEIYVWEFVVIWVKKICVWNIKIEWIWFRWVLVEGGDVELVLCLCGLVGCYLVDSYGYMWLGSIFLLIGILFVICGWMFWDYYLKEFMLVNYIVFVV